jgi:hypothetical protein
MPGFNTPYIYTKRSGFHGFHGFHGFRGFHGLRGFHEGDHLSMVPLQLRNAASTFVLFEMAKRESRIVYDELGDHATFDEWLQMLNFVYDRKYRFLLIRVNQPRALRYYKDFDLIRMLG